MSERQQAPAVVLVGFMGAGKTTVGRLVAERLGLPFVDSDLVIEHEQRRSIADLFGDVGEAGFRDLEQETVARLLTGSPCVLSLGGGACGREATRAALRGHPVVHLHVELDEALRRVGDDARRPLLRDSDLAQLYAQRLEVYAATATSTARTTGRSVEDVAVEVIDLLTGGRDLGARGRGIVTRPGASRRVPVGDVYEVHLGRGILVQASRSLPEPVERVVVVHSGSVRAVAAEVAARVRDDGRAAHLHEVPDAEAAKTATVAEQLWHVLGREGITRSDAVIGVGGGAVTDLAGFVAATWLRGVAVVHVPTSLAGMVDASIGGKTGVNTAEGKNLVGVFHPPVAVVCDVDTLLTLPPAELRPGMAEVVKHGFIADPRTLELVEADPQSACDPAGDVLPELIERSVRVKAQVVAADLREASLREILNYGHTFGHAVEQVEGYAWRHGSAVSVGLVYAAALGRLAGRTPAAVAQRHTEILASLGLPVSYRPDRWPALLAAMRRDKKSRGAMLRFVVLDDLARPGRLEGPPEDLLEAAYRAVAGEPR